MIKFEDMYGAVTLRDYPSNAELDFLKSLGVNTIWLMGTDYDLILRCRDKGINCIPYIGHTAFGDPLENVPCYMITDEPFGRDWTYEQVRDRAIESRSLTSKPVGYNFTWWGGIYQAFPALNDYVDFTSIDCYPSHGGFHEDDLINTWNFIQGYVRVPVIIVGQAFEHAEFDYPDVKRQKDFWLPKPVGLLWYNWSNGGGLIKTDKSIQEAIRIAAYEPTPVYTKKSVTCPQCGSELELTISSKAEENLAQNCPVCGQGITNLLAPYGDMESWSGRPVPDGWTCVRSKPVRSAVKKYGNYCLRLTSNGNWAYAYHDMSEIDYYKGRKVTLGCWVRAEATNDQEAGIAISDGVGRTSSAWPPKDGVYHFLTATRTIDPAATRVRAELLVNNTPNADTDDEAFFDGAILVEGGVCRADMHDIGRAYAVEVIKENPWPVYTKKTVTCSGCGAELELTISSDPSENTTQRCPVCETPAD